MDAAFGEALARDGGDDAAPGLVASRNRGKDLLTMNDANRGRPSGQARVRLLELWERTSSRSGRRYLSGFLGGLSVVAFAETRAHPKRPDEELTVWTVYASESERPPRQGPARGDEARAPGRRLHRREGAKARQQQAAAEAAPAQHSGEPEDLDDAMPF
jgi:hypothetical protein